MTQLFHGAEGEEDEVVGGAGASIMAEAMAKEVNTHFALQQTRNM